MTETPPIAPPASEDVSKRSPHRMARIALRTSLLYWFVAAGYILLSDRAVELLTFDPQVAARVQTFKGWAFVTVTALLLYLALRGQLARWEREAAERRRTAETLRTRMTQIEAILARQPIAFFACDRSGVFTLWEGRIWPEANFPPRNVVGRNVKHLADELAPVRDAVERALRGETIAIEQHLHTRTFEIFHSPLRSPTGESVGVSGVVVDITERKRLEAQLLRAQRLESVGRLAGGVAHDLNNMLSPVLIGASLLKTKVHDADSVSLLETMEASAKRGAGIIRKLLTFSRGAAGEIVPLRLQTLVADMHNIIRETFPKNIVARVTYPEASLVVHGDATQLQQVLMNLCVNARDAMPEGGTLTLAIESAAVDETMARLNPGAKPGEFAVLRVRDTGTGIAPEHLDQVFDPFFTTKELGRGTGLGLSTVLGIVKSHGGFIQVDTTVGEGTQFSIYFPRSHDVEPAPEKKTQQPAVLRGGGECILIVDDEPSVRRVLRQALECADYRVVEAEDGAAGILRLSEHRADVRLVITDVMMPTMDAIAFVRAIRKLDARLPIISISGVEVPEKLDELKSLGVAAFLRKPFALDALLDVVRQQLVADR